MRVVAAILMMVVMAGCTSARSMYAAPGEKRYAIDCPTLQPKLCEERARKECGGGFRVVAERDDVQGRTLIVDCR